MVNTRTRFSSNKALNCFVGYFLISRVLPKPFVQPEQKLVLKALWNMVSLLVFSVRKPHSANAFSPQSSARLLAGSSCYFFMSFSSHQVCHVWYTPVDECSFWPFMSWLTITTMKKYLFMKITVKSSFLLKGNFTASLNILQLYFSINNTFRIYNLPCLTLLTR